MFSADVRIRNLKTQRFLLVGSVVLGAVILLLLVLCVYVYFREKPRVQLVGQSMANLTMVISMFIDQNGRMPNGIDDLVEAGLVKKIKPCRPPGLNDKRATTEYRLNLRYGDHVLYYMDDVVVNWDVTPECLEVRDGILVSRPVGEPDFIIGRRDLFKPERTVYHLDFSLLLFEALSNPSRNRDPTDD